MANSAFQQPASPSPLPVANGGTGASTLASNGVLYGNGTSAVQALAVNSAAQTKFLSQASSGAPAWNGIFTGASMAKAYLNASTSAITKNTFVKVPFDSTSWNVGSNYSTANSKYTAPRAGKYLLCVNVVMGNVSGGTLDLYCAIWLKNATTYRGTINVLHHNQVPNNTTYGASGATVVELAASEDVEVYVYIVNDNQIIYGNGADTTWIAITELPA